MRKKRIILNTYITDLLNLRIVVDAYSKTQKIKGNTNKQSFNTESKSNIKKVLKNERHK